MSNLGFVLAGLHGMRRTRPDIVGVRFWMQHLSVVVIGIGSAAFHGTLRKAAQQLDETPMMWSILVWFYCLYAPVLAPSREQERLLTAVLATLLAVFTVAHWFLELVMGFQLMFGAVVVVCLARFTVLWKRSDTASSFLAHLYLHSLLVAFACWLVDFHACHVVSEAPVQLHAWWHVFMSVNAYTGPVFVEYATAARRGARPTIAYTFGCVPYVAYPQGAKAL